MHWYEGKILLYLLLKPLQTAELGELEYHDFGNTECSRLKAKMMVGYQRPFTNCSKFVFCLTFV